MSNISFDGIDSVLREAVSQGVNNVFIEFRRSGVTILFSDYKKGESKTVIENNNLPKLEPSIFSDFWGEKEDSLDMVNDYDFNGTNCRVRSDCWELFPEGKSYQFKILFIQN